MSKSLKVMLIIGAVLIGIGIIVVLAVGFSSGWQFSTANAEYKTYETEVGAEITDIDLDFSAGTLKVEFYDGDVIKVEYPETKQITTECKVTGKTLKIKSIVHWHVQFWGFNKIPPTRIYIPQNTVLGLKMDVSAGSISFGAGAFSDVDIKISAGAITMGSVKCDDFNLKMSAGAVDVSQIQCNRFKADLSAGALNVKGLNCDNIGLDVSAGAADLSIAGKKSDYTIQTDVSAGSCNVRSQSGGSKRLTVDVSAGSVDVSFEG